MMGRITMIIRHKSSFLLIRIERHACYLGHCMVWRRRPACGVGSAARRPALRASAVLRVDVTTASPPLTACEMAVRRRTLQRRNCNDGVPAVDGM